MGMREILWEAFASKVGIEVAISDEAVFRRRFYAERAKAREEGITDFDNLSLISPPPDVTGKLWIVKEGKPNGQELSQEEVSAGEEIP